MKGGFTIIELIIVTVVVLILASAAVAGAQPLMQTLRLNNSANQVTLFLQRARNLAATETDGPMKMYGVYFENRKLILFKSAKKLGDAPQLFEAGDIVEEYVPEGPEITNAVTNSIDQPCNILAAVVYEATTGRALLVCNAISPTIPSMKLKVTSSAGGIAKERVFKLQEGTGVPQGG